jgi:hypothetical protein
MGEDLHSQYNKIPLTQFVERLRDECYSSIEKICASARKQADLLYSLELQHSTSQYIVMCSKLVEETLDYIKARKEKYIPYIAELFQKAETKHDCANCSGNCKVGHSMQLVELRSSNGSIKDILYRLQIVALPLYSETIYPDAYRVLRNQMALLENNISELFFLEETYLIPKVIEAQKMINVSS